MSAATSLAQPLAVFLTPMVWSILIALRAKRVHVLGSASLFAITGLLVNASVVAPLSAAVSLCAGIVVVLFLGLLNLTSRVTTLTLGIALVSLPVGAWLYPLAGLLFAGAVSAVIVWRSRGIDYLRMTTGETMAAVGFAGAAVMKPDLDRLPVEAEAQQSLDSPKADMGKDGRRANADRISLPSIMLGALLVGLLIGIVFSGH